MRNRGPECRQLAPLQRKCVCADAAAADDLEGDVFLTEDLALAMDVIDLGQRAAYSNCAISRYRAADDLPSEPDGCDAGQRAPNLPKALTKQHMQLPFRDVIGGDGA